MRRIGCGVQDVGLEKRKEQGPRDESTPALPGRFCFLEPACKAFGFPDLPESLLAR